FQVLVSISIGIFFVCSTLSKLFFKQMPAYSMHYSSRYNLAHYIPELNLHFYTDGRKKLSSNSLQNLKNMLYEKHVKMLYNDCFQHRKELQRKFDKAYQRHDKKMIESLKNVVILPCENLKKLGLISA
ncbi:MAG: hypothetical protein MHPSP_002981, partial [Paramarteilia canceri]